MVVVPPIVTPWAFVPKFALLPEILILPPDVEEIAVVPAVLRPARLDELPPVFCPARLIVPAAV
jgi:hypothetical protein